MEDLAFTRSHTTSPARAAPTVAWCDLRDWLALVDGAGQLKDRVAAHWREPGFSGAPPQLVAFPAE
jgi:hypothetical protein